MTNSEADASDAALVMAVARWQEAALAEIYRRHGGAVFGLAMRTLGERTRSEEIVQEVFLRLWNTPDKFDPERGSLRAYLLAQAHARAVDVVRQESARRRREDRHVRARSVETYDLEHEVVDMTVAEEMREVVDALPQEERQAIALAYYGGHTYREVAALLGAPEGTVKSRIRSGLRRMRDGLAASGVGRI
jgi:RNA polymerase sigma-70 factor (ECF subfamily)